MGIIGGGGESFKNNLSSEHGFSQLSQFLKQKTHLINFP